MPQITIAQLRRLGEHIGHRDFHVVESRRGWHASCSCGWRSGRVPDRAQAEQVVADHLASKAESWSARVRASGRNPVDLISQLDRAAS